MWILNTVDCWHLCKTIYPPSILYPVSGERRFWMTSPITLRATQISGCLLARGRSCGRRRRSSETFATPLARTGRSPWTLLGDKCLTRGITSMSTTKSEAQWRPLESRTDLCCIAGSSTFFKHFLLSYSGWMIPSRPWATILRRVHQRFLQDKVEDQAAEI